MKIIIKDDLHPEDGAMVQALYSRSPASVDEHLQKVERVGSGQFMKDYYVGYGHASIGDCGSTTMFIEGVSMLMAKAVQDHPLYSGQEASTRYMDFSNARFEAPGTDAGPEGHEIQREWIRFYNATFPLLLEHHREIYPPTPKDEADPGKYERALRARTFDVLRGFIPAGAHTNLSWHTNLRQAHDKLRWLVAHPEMHTAELALALLGRLHMKYPNSGFDWKLSDDEWEWRRAVMAECAYTDDPLPVRRVNLSFTNFSWIHNAKYMKLLKTRPRYMPVPNAFAQYGTIGSNFRLDFGSFRDLQRHRNGLVQMPLLTTRWGFHPWYFEQLPPDIREAARLLVESQVRAIEALPVNPVQKQSYIAMGFEVVCGVTQSLPAFIYRTELRTGPMVHQTLRLVAQEEVRLFEEYMQREIPIYANMSPDVWDVRRGGQTILPR